jgi:hypothetical protein
MVKLLSSPKLALANSSPSKTMQKPPNAICSGIDAKLRPHNSNLINAYFIGNFWIPLPLKGGHLG